MIQFKRGKTKSWRAQKKPLEAGQPGYDKDKHKIKIGDGEHLWNALPYASGLGSDEILLSETQAKLKKILDPEDSALITYGTESPNKQTVGQIYLQYYDTDPEVDYIIESGIADIGEIGEIGVWTYQKYKSGLARCQCTIKHETSIQGVLGDNLLYQNSTAIKSIKYPIVFKEIPSEVATIQSPGSLVWLATSKGLNTNKQSAIYTIISPDKSTNNAIYQISLMVEGSWK